MSDTADTPNDGPPSDVSADGTATPAPDTTKPTVISDTLFTGSVIDAQEMRTIRFSEVVTDFVASDITASGAEEISLSGSGDTYSLTFTPTAATFTLTIAANSVSDTASPTPNTGPAKRGGIDGHRGIYRREIVRLNSLGRHFVAHLCSRLPDIHRRRG